MPATDEIETIEQKCLEAGIPGFFLHAKPNLLDAGLEAQLTEAGCRRYRGWM